MLDKNQVRVIFLFKFKMGRKAAKTTCNINNAFSPGAANEHILQWWVKKFCKGDESLKDEECSDQSWEVHNDQLRAIIKANPLITTWEVAEELQHRPLYDHCTFEANWKGEKAWQVGASQADQESKKSSLWSVVFTYSTQQQQTISLLDCDMWQKEDFTMTSLVTGLRRSSQVLPKAKLVPQKKVMVTVWWSAAGLIPYSFLNPDKTITSEKYTQQIKEMHWKLQCLQPALVNRKVPVLHNNIWPHIVQPMLQKLNELRYKVLLHPPFHLTSHQPATTALSILTTFCRENASTTIRRQKIAFQEFIKSQSRFLCSRNKQTYFSLAKMCWL